MNLSKIVLGLLLALSVAFGAFDEEEYMFRALDLQDQGKVREARDTYLVLYDETKKLEYLKESILLSIGFEQPNIVLGYIEDYKREAQKKKLGEDLEIDKALLDVYLKTNNPTKALPIAQKIAKEEDSPIIHNALAVIYASLGDLPSAIKEFQILYEESKSPEVLQKLIMLYGQTQQYQKGIELLDSYLQENECEGDLCAMAIQIYAKAMQGDKIESILKKRYDDEPTIANAQNLIHIYSLRQKYHQALEIASRYPFDPKILFNLYAQAKDYANAYKSALDVYKNSKQAMYLGFAQMYRFETLANKTNPKEVLPVLQDMQKAIELIQELRKEFWSDVYVAGDKDNFNQELEKALRLADFLEIGELMARDALNRKESCGGHFREEMQTEDGETKRDDENFMYVAAWEYKGQGAVPEMHKEPLKYENIKIATRNYKD